jgi:hypothetical protein
MRLVCSYAGSPFRIETCGIVARANLLFEETAMTESWSTRIVRILPNPGQVLCTPIEANALLEVAYLAMAIDQETNAAEAEAFRELSIRLKGLVDSEAAPLSEMDLSTVLGTFKSRSPHGREMKRIQELSALLGADSVRWLAYQVAFAMTLIDFETSEEEIAIDQAFRDALGITEDKGEELRKAVYQKLEA